MKYNFNWSAVSGGAPYVTISQTSIAFNSVSIEKLGNPEKVDVGFDEENCIIGIKPHDNSSTSSKPFVFAEKIKNGWVRIGCRDFVKYLQVLTGVGFKPAKKYIATYDAINEILIINVKGHFENEKSDTNKA